MTAVISGVLIMCFTVLGLMFAVNYNGGDPHMPRIILTGACLGMITWGLASLLS